MRWTAAVLLSGLLTVVGLAIAARWWCAHKNVHRMLFLPSLLLFPAVFVALLGWAGFQDASVVRQAHAQAAMVKLARAVDAFPAARCAEPNVGPKPLLEQLPPSTKLLLERAEIHPEQRWRNMYSLHPNSELACPLPSARPAAVSPPGAPSTTPTSLAMATPTASAPTPTGSPVVTATPSTEDAASAAVSAAAAVWIESTQTTTTDWVSSAFDHLDRIVFPGSKQGAPLLAGPAVWLIALTILLVAYRHILDRSRLAGGAPLVVVPAATPETASGVAEARSALLAAAQETRLVQPTAAPSSSGESVLASLEVATAVVPQGAAVVKALRAVRAYLLPTARFDIALTFNGDRTLVVSVVEEPGGRSVLERSVSDDHPEALGRSIAFDAGSAILSRNRYVPSWGRWPPGTGEALDHYVQALREARPPTKVDKKTREAARHKRRDDLRWAARKAPGNGLIRHELGLLEFQTGNQVGAMAAFVENATQFPSFHISRYRLAVTFAMASADVAAMWFTAPAGLRQAVTEARHASDGQSSHLLRVRATDAAVSASRKWLLDEALAELCALPAHWEWRPRGNWALRQTTAAARRSVAAVRRAVHESEIGAAALTNYLGYKDGLALQLLTARKGACTWQAPYNEACGLARLYGIAVDTGCSEETRDRYARAAVERLETAVRRPDFSLARWQEDAVDLLSAVDPDLARLHTQPRFVSLMLLLDPSGSVEAR